MEASIGIQQMEASIGIQQMEAFVMKDRRR